ncbi:hypothetical protein OTB20_38585 [Streptomyces sp. H27-H1]|uniref:hypothetical protein n=1 Tax=Streptomyces sp. H27-H1 TaxID=2996461 RepID=UPI00226ECBD8|nr:hypothetical protein [Streptomyces sp. H27-H1]MCY0931984.1 hypothetical protein [Streptomyces sp. H27-H1]
MIRHDTFQQEMLSLAPADEEETRAARGVVASRSRDAIDCTALLGMLGLLPEPPSPEPDRATPRIHVLPPLLEGKRRQRRL